MKKILILPALILVGNILLAQELPSIIPPSPEAAGLGKYGQYPVSLHTGVPQISIPIYTLKGKQLSVPISIDYHASGFKVDELAISLRKILAAD